MSKSLMFILVLVMVVCSGASAQLTVNQTTGTPAGPTDFNTIQAAILAAPNGATITITDSATYVEDILIPNNAGANKQNLKIVAGPGQSPVIQASNTLSGFPNRGLLGIIQGLVGGGVDKKGFIIEGDGTLLRGLTIENLSPTGDPALNSTSALAIMADNVTIENCVINTIHPTSGDKAAVLVVSGAWQIVNAALGGALNAPGYARAIPVNNLQFKNTVIKNSDIALASVDYANALILLQTGGANYIPPLSPTIGMDNVEIYGGDDVMQAAVGTITGTNCYIHDNADAVGLEGATGIFENSVFENAPNQVIYINADLGFGGVKGTGIFNNCVICGSGDRIIRIDEGVATFTNCIIRSGKTGDPNHRLIDFRPHDFANNFFLLPAPFPGPQPTGLTIDNCDLYNPDGVAIATENGDLDPAGGNNTRPATSVSITDSIIQAAVGISLTTISTESNVSRTATVTNNDIFATTQANIDAGWTQTVASNLNLAPGWFAPQLCGKQGFNYTAGTALDTASSTGGFLGSQGPLNQGSGVEKWELY